MTLTITFLLQVIIVLIVILIFCMGYLVIMRNREESGLRKKEAYIREKQMLWYHYFKEEGVLQATLIPKNQSEVQAVVEIFFSYIHNLSTPEILEKIKLFSNEHLKQPILKQLKSKRWGNRINAMNRIIDFRIDGLLDDCEKMNMDKLSIDERFHLFRIYAAFGHTQFMEKLITFPADFSEHQYKRLFMSLDENYLPEIIKQMKELPEHCQYALLDTLGGRGRMEDIPFLEALLNHENDEIRIRSLKAIQKIGMMIDPKRYEQFSTSPIWEERLMYTKVLGNSSITYAWPYLQQFLQDDSWWVRLQAAEIIGKDKRGAELLQSFIETASDLYAVDRAKEILARRG